jgi:hypothetical protein
MPIVMTRDDATIRYRLREARASLKFHAPSSAARRRTFLAALQQFEELVGAAAAVGPASRPLPLFYALSQGGRAITAAHALGVWELAGHGISMPPQSSSLPLLKKQVAPRPGKSDSFITLLQLLAPPHLLGLSRLAPFGRRFPLTSRSLGIRTGQRFFNYTLTHTAVSCHQQVRNSKPTYSALHSAGLGQAMYDGFWTTILRRRAGISRVGPSLLDGRLRVAGKLNWRGQ